MGRERRKWELMLLTLLHSLWCGHSGSLALNCMWHRPVVNCRCILCPQFFAHVRRYFQTSTQSSHTSISQHCTALCRLLM